MAYFLKNNNEDQNQSGNQNQMSGGNIYSTSGSEVSTPTSTSSNSSSNSSQSNESGNWINLNKYLDANQGKVSSYVDNLVKPYSDSASQFKNDAEDSKQSYIKQVNDNTVSKDQANTIISNYRKDGSSITDADYYKVSNPIRGTFGVSQYEETEDYKNLNNKADELGQVGQNLGNENYLKSLMGNSVSSGGKNFNSFLIRGNQPGKDKITDYSNQFSELASFLDNQSSELNDARNKGMEESITNAQEAYNNAKGDGGKGIYSAYNEELSNVLRAYGYNPRSVNSRASYTDKLPSTKRLTTSDGTVLTLSPKNRGTTNQEAMRAGYSDTSRLDSLETGKGRLDTKLGSMFKYTEDEWNNVVRRNDNLQRMITSPKDETESAITSIIVGALSPAKNEYGLKSRPDTIREVNVAKVVSNYLDGYYDGGINPLASFYSDLRIANRG